MASPSSPSPFRRRLLAALIPGGLCVIIGGFILSFSLVAYFYTPGQCTITGKHSVSQKHSGKSTTYEPIFEFTVRTTDQHTYQATGYTAVQEFRSAKVSGAILASYQIGSTYACWYNPINPTHAVLVQELSFSGLLWFFIGVGLLGFILLLGLWVKRLEQ
jgi:hypothetical protein